MRPLLIPCASVEMLNVFIGCCELAPITAEPVPSGLVNSSSLLGSVGERVLDALVGLCVGVHIPNFTLPNSGYLRRAA